MKYRKIGMTVGLVAILATSLVEVGAVQAWGPERPTYTNEAPADHAVFNSITNNAAVGDERDFVRVSEKGSGKTHSSEIEIEAGKQYEVFIYYHNDASETFNSEAKNFVGIARDARVSSSFPFELKQGERGMITGRITATNTDPKAVWDEAYVTAKEDMTLHYVLASAKIYNAWDTNNSVLPTSLFSDQGTFLGFRKLNGVLFGCDAYSGQVVYTIQTEAVEKPEEPTPAPEPDEPTEPEPEPKPEKPAPKPETPKELPETGPAEIVLAVIILLSLIAGGLYWYRTHKTVKKATRKARGRK